MTSDAEASSTFYGQLFGWTADEPNEDFGGYFNYEKDALRVAGCMTSQPDWPVTNLWSIYLTSEDSRKTVEEAVGHGGQVLVPAMDIADLGTMAQVIDVGGAVIGMWQPGSFPGFGMLAETGAPSWFELHTRDYQKSIEFYRDVFGWQTHVVSDDPEFRYTVLDRGGEWMAGIADASGYLPEGVPAHWSVYFGVDDTDAALTKVVALGGTIVRPAEDSPYGRLATAQDATGAQFKLVAPNEAMPARS